MRWVKPSACQSPQAKSQGAAQQTPPHRHRTYRCGVVATRSCRQHAAFRLGPPRSHVTYCSRAEFRWYVADGALSTLFMRAMTADCGSDGQWEPDREGTPGTLS